MKSTTVFRFFSNGTLLALAAGCAGAQTTQVDLRTQSKAVDFSTAASTTPFHTGTVLPGTCSLSQIFFKTDAVAGANVYACTAANTWTLEGGNATGPTLSGNNSWSGNNDFTGAVSVSLPAPWVATTATNTYTAGAKQVFLPSATTAGFRIVSGTVPSSLVGGDLFVTVAGNAGIFDGSNANLFPVVTGSGGTPALPPANGKCAEWGAGVSLGVSAANGPCASAVAVPASSSSACTVGQYSANSSFHYDCIATNTWVRSAAATW